MTPGDSERAIIHIYNSAVAASAIGAAWELGMFDELHTQGMLDVQNFAAERGLDTASVLGLFRALSAVEIVEREDFKILPGVHFSEAYRNKSFFHWLTRGSADLFRRAPEVVRTENRVGDFCPRDSAAIAFACREISKFCYDPWFWQTVQGLDFDFHVVADLGCGSGERLMQLLGRHPGTRAVGIDIAQPAVRMATAAAAAAGFADRMTFMQADVLTMAPVPAFDEVELLTCFMMGHDFWPRQRCIENLRRLRTLFPRARRFLLGDATRSEGVADRDLPIFALGFEVAHDMMGTFIPTVRDWESVFEEGGWRLRSKNSIDIAVGEVIFELERL